MRKYRVKTHINTTLSGSTVVEADDPEQAKEIVSNRLFDVKFTYKLNPELVGFDSIEDAGPVKSCRKLASIQKISEIVPIEGADSIETASVLGWKCVVKKGEFKPGDLGVFIEIDSMLPERPEFEFMRPRHFRVRTVKLKGQVSQGLMIPASSISYADLSSCAEGDDVTEQLSILKYEPDIPSQLRGKIAGMFPSFLHKTDEVRIQSVPGLLARHTGKMFYATEKLDGSSFTAYAKDNPSAEGYSETNRIRKFGICSRNLELKPDDDYFSDGDIRNSFWKVAKHEKLEEKLRSLDRNIAVQGEMVGPGVQKNKYYLDTLKLFVFNVFDIDASEFFSFENMKQFCTSIGLTMVPVIDTFVLDHSVNQLVDMSMGTSVLCSRTQREGLVFRTVENSFDEDTGRTSFKAINPKFLLKYDE